MSNETIRAKIIQNPTIRVQAPSLSAENRPWCLVVVSPGAMVGQRFELGDAAIVGREGSVDVKIPEPSVSRRHCHIFRKRGGYWVTDLGATNPTRVNGIQVKASPLLEGDLLSIGELVLKLLGPRNPENALVAALIDQASKDQLTGLSNRRSFRAAMEEAFNEYRQEGKDLALLVLDIDHFKHINDRFGHPAGDRVLSTVGRIMRDQARATDLPGRIGGEEFAVLLRATVKSEAQRIAERMRLSLAALQLIEDGEPIPVTGSFGIACANGDDVSADMLYSRADAALYEAKRSGRNRVIVAAELP